jgi:hypothetical protein
LIDQIKTAAETQVYNRGNQRAQELIALQRALALLLKSALSLAAR